MARPVRDISGERFGRLVVIARSGEKNRNVAWRCICDCGNEHIAAGHHLRRGNIRSCGCLRNDVSTTHRGSNEELYTIWCGIHSRCYNTRNTRYIDYGGRGIQVCDRWHDYAKFRDDMGQPPEGMSIERIDNDGNYCPDNCRWATRKEQARNRRSTRRIELGGRSLSLVEMVERLGLNYRTVVARLWRGWSVEESFSK